MSNRARLYLSRLWTCLARRAGLMVCLWLMSAGASSAGGAIVDAAYGAPTARYGHGILGDAIEWGTLKLTLKDGRRISITLPETRVFEDTQPRLVDLDGDGAPEVIVVETSLTKGARLSVYGPDGLLAATPFIGRAHRWLAPVGAADLDGDGAVEVAYIDRPHLAEILRIWRFQNGQLVHVADESGVSNHKIGWDFIAGGLRTCGQAPELILANGTWDRIIAATLNNGHIQTRDLGRYSGPDSLTAALNCP